MSLLFLSFEEADHFQVIAGARQAESCHVAFRGDIWIGSSSNKQLNNLQMPTFCRLHEWCIAELRGWIRLGTGVEKQPGDLG